MDHRGTMQLETERLILRRFVLGDAEAMYRNWASDPEVTRFLTWKTHRDVSDSREILKKWIREYKNRDYYQWAIVPKSSTEPIGCIAAVDLDDETSCVQIGYCLGKAWWRQGIMTEALRAAIRFFFEETGANRIEGRHDVCNPHSGAVMQKCGMRYEGTLRGAARNNCGICDVCVYGLLCTDGFGT